MSTLFLRSPRAGLRLGRGRALVSPTLLPCRLFVSTRRDALRREAPASLPQPPSPSIDELLHASDAIRLRSRLSEVKESAVSWPQYVEMCTSLGISSEGTCRLAQDLQHSGELLHIRGSVYLRPGELVASMLKLSQLAAHPPGEHSKEDGEPSEARLTVNELDARARVATSRIVLGIGAGLALQSAVLFRLTFWEYGWDVIEPISYFMNMGTLLGTRSAREAAPSARTPEAGPLCRACHAGWYFFFAATRQEAAYMSMDAYVYRRVRARIYERAGVAKGLVRK